MRFSRPLVAMGVLAAQVLVVAPHATAAVTCAFDPHAAVVRVDMAHDEDWATVARERGGRAIFVNGKRCGDASVRNVDRIRVVGGPGLQFLTIDLSGGPLGPGKTPERTRVSEIEISFEAGLSYDYIDIRGGPSADTIGLGSAGAALGRRARPRGGGDVVIGYTGPDTLDAGPGEDRIWGSDGDDWIDAGKGADRVSAGTGDDRLFLDDGVQEAGIACGAGSDVIKRADHEDLEIAIGCETVPV